MDRPFRIGQETVYDRIDDGRKIKIHGYIVDAYYCEKKLTHKEPGWYLLIRSGYRFYEKKLHQIKLL